MKKPLWHMVLGVIIGIAAGLSVTLLSPWGHILLKLIVGVFGGFTIGIFAVSPKDAKSIFVNVFKKGKDLLNWLIKEPLKDKINPSCLFLSMVFRVLLIAVYLYSSVILLISFLEFMIPDIQSSKPAAILFCIFLLFDFLLPFWILFAPYFEGPDIPRSVKIKVWGPEVIRAGVTSGELLTEVMNNGMSAKKVELKVLKTNFYLALYVLKLLVKIFAGTLALIITLALLIVLIPFWFMQEVFKASWIIAFFASIAIGVCTGTFWEPIFGYPLWGFIAGISTFLSLFALYKYVPGVKFSVIWEKTFVAFITYIKRKPLIA